MFGDRHIRPISIDMPFARPIVYGSMRNILILNSLTAKPVLAGEKLVATYSIST
jgi:hypothetical protein